MVEPMTTHVTHEEAEAIFGHTRMLSADQQKLTLYIAQARRMEEAARALLKQARAIEWNGRDQDNSSECPSCHELGRYPDYATGPHGGVHDADCALATAMNHMVEALDAEAVRAAEKAVSHE